MPRSVITSLSHITTIDPVTRASAVWATNTTSLSPSTAYWRRIIANTMLCTKPHPSATYLVIWAILRRPASPSFFCRSSS